MYTIGWGRSRGREEKVGEGRGSRKSYASDEEEGDEEDCSGGSVSKF